MTSQSCHHSTVSQAASHIDPESWSPRVVAIIPARGGSKGIPRKNLVEVAGKPLILHTIEQAQATPGIDEVVVSTEDPEISALSSTHGATIVDRPPELAGDHASSESALIHALDYLHARDGRDPDLVVFLQATSPLRPPGAIADAVEQLVREAADSLFSASPLHGFVWRVERGSPVSVSYDHRCRPRRQEAREHLEENGSIYVVRPTVLRKHENRLGGKITVFRMDPVYSFQIDGPQDLEVIKAVAALLEPRGSTSSRDPSASNVSG